ncbi:MAG TPA: hypothetical protein VGF45_00390 [Polyangia bacterium]
MASALVAVTLVLAGACVPASVMYNGPRYAAHQVSRVRVRGAVVDRVDGVRTNAFDVEVLPGPHTLSVRRAALPLTPFEPSRFLSDQSLPICFTAAAGAEYSIDIATAADGRWWPQVHATDGRPLSVERGPAGADKCRRSLPPAQSLAAQTPEPGPAHASAAVVASDVPPAAPTTLSSQRPFGRGLGFGLGFDVAKFWGGDEFRTYKLRNGKTGRLKAGEGAYAGIHVTITPLRAGPIGLGFDLGAGVTAALLPTEVKHLSNTMLAASLSAHMLATVRPRFHLLGRGGVFGGSLLEDHQSFGPMFELGGLWTPNAYTGYSLVVRRTQLRIKETTRTIDAGSFGLVLGVRFY